MSDHSKIEWTDATWNPLRGCSRISEGCRHCYAERMASRFSKPGMAYAGLIHPTTKGWNDNVRLVPDLIDQPLKWKKPRRIFVNSMSDLFHENVPEAWIDAVFATMALAQQHSFQVLTKRPHRMLDYLKRLGTAADAWRPRTANGEFNARDVLNFRHMHRHHGLATALPDSWPLPNVWLGVSVENQAAADKRIPLLLQCPAAMHWVSCEPLLGPVDLRWFLTRNVWKEGRAVVGADYGHGKKLDWVVVGGESGPGARPMHPDWARSPRDQCASAGVPFFLKQWGEWAPIDSWQPWHRKPQIAIRADGSPMPDEEWHEDGCRFKQIGKRGAGRLLDGIEHNAFPEQRA